MPAREWLRLPVLSAGAEYLVMGYLMRRNILTYKAPPLNEGYDLICIHPDARHRARAGKALQVRVQVKSRFAADCDRGFPLKTKSEDAFDYVIVVFQNIGRFARGRDGSEGARPPEFYTLPAKMISRFRRKGGWEKVILRGHEEELEGFKDDRGFELIAKHLGIPRPRKVRE